MNNCYSNIILIFLFKRNSIEIVRKMSGGLGCYSHEWVKEI